MVVSFIEISFENTDLSWKFYHGVTEPVFA